MTVNDVYVLMQEIVNKSQTGYLDPVQFNSYINQAQRDLLDYLLGEFQTYQVGRPIAKVQYSMTEQTRQRLTPFIAPPTLLTIDGTGFAAYPTDYQQTDTMLDINNNRIRYAQQHKEFSYLASVIDPIATNPIYLIQSNGFQFYPITLGSAKLSYVGTPPAIVWGFTPDVNGIPVYNAGTSVDPKWYDADMMKIISRALDFLGVNLSSQQITAFARGVKIQGQ